jgi:hypothetical protein
MALPSMISETPLEYIYHVVNNSVRQRNVFVVLQFAAHISCVKSLNAVFVSPTRNYCRGSSRKLNLRGAREFDLRDTLFLAEHPFPPFRTAVGHASQSNSGHLQARFPEASYFACR